MVLLAQWMKSHHPVPVPQVNGAKPITEVTIHFFMTFANIVETIFIFSVLIVNRSKEAASIFLFLYRGLSVKIIVFLEPIWKWSKNTRRQDRIFPRNELHFCHRTYIFCASSLTQKWNGVCLLFCLFVYLYAEKITFINLCVLTCQKHRSIR